MENLMKTLGKRNAIGRKRRWDLEGISSYFALGFNAVVLPGLWLGLLPGILFFPSRYQSCLGHVATAIFELIRISTPALGSTYLSQKELHRKRLR